MSVLHQTHLVIAVKACQEVNIFLSQLMHSQDPRDLYKITLQDANGRSSIWYMCDNCTNMYDVHVRTCTCSTSSDLL